MRDWPLTIVVSVLVIATIIVLPAKAQERPFSQEQVQAMVGAGLADETGGKVVEQRGINFSPTENFLQSLKAAGANEAFLKALRMANRSQTTDKAQKKPLGDGQVLDLLLGQVPSHRVTMLIRECGINFEPTDDYLNLVRSRGGEGELVSALTSEGEVRHHAARAEKYELDGQLGDAEAEYRTAIRLRPNESDLHCSLGSVLGKKGDSGGEIAEYREAVRLDPKNEYAHVELGLTLDINDDQEGAIAEFQEVLRLNPDDDLTRVYLGRSLAHKGDWEGGIAEFREALHPMPKDYSKSGRDFDLYRLAQLEAHDAIGLALEHKGEWDGAIAEYREALRMNPKFGVGRLRLAMALERKRDWDGAIAEYLEILRQEPEYGYAHIKLGGALRQEGDLDAAIAEYRKALRLNAKDEDETAGWRSEQQRLKSEDAVAHFSLGLALEAKADLQAALQEYRAAYELDPKDTDYRRAYERLLHQANH